MCRAWAFTCFLPRRRPGLRSSRPTRAPGPLSIERPRGRAPLGQRPSSGVLGAAIVISSFKTPRCRPTPPPNPLDAAGGGTPAPGGGVRTQGQQGASKQEVRGPRSIRPGRSPLRLGLACGCAQVLKAHRALRRPGVPSHAALAPLPVLRAQPRGPSSRRLLCGCARAGAALRWGRPSLHAGPWPQGLCGHFSRACQPLWTPRWSGL